MMRRRERSPRPAPTWTRNKMLAMLAGGAVAAIMVIVGLVLAVIFAVRGKPTNHRPTAATASPSAGPSETVSAVTTATNELAARPMATVDPAAARPGRVSAADPGPPIVLPKGTAVGAAGVPTGFPHTPEGALAQMAAIDQTAMQSGSLVGVRAVIAGWALPGGPTTSSWSGVKAMASFLDAAHLSGGGSQQLGLVVTPLMGMIKGTVDADNVVPCVDFEFDATLDRTARVASADCERMTWHGNRWMIGPGDEPAEAPSVWPDTDAAIAAGYRDLHHG